MGSSTVFLPAKLVIGLLSSPPAAGRPERSAELSAALEERFGPLEALGSAGSSLDFVWSGYYDEEMGGRPIRSFYAFQTLVDPSSLADIKKWTGALELEFALRGKRSYNLDPGILSLSRFVLATTKDRPQRLPLAEGIYADLTLIYERGDYRPLPWTYPDWKSEEYRRLLRGLRPRLKSALRLRET